MGKASACLLLLGLLPAAAPADEAGQPDVALLEFLGSWEDAEGDWIDPLRLLEEAQATSPQTSAQDAPATQTHGQAEPRGSGQ